MSTINSTSTDADIRAAYLDNCTYSEDGSVDKAKAFVSACRAMIVRGITVIDQAGERLEMSPPALQREITEANRFVGLNSAGRTVFRDLRSFRS